MRQILPNALVYFLIIESIIVANSTLQAIGLSNFINIHFLMASYTALILMSIVPTAVLSVLLALFHAKVLTDFKK